MMDIETQANDMS